jgi:hypothetical protein
VGSCLGRPGTRRYLVVIEIILGVVAPTLIAGPWILMGLGEGFNIYSRASEMPVPSIERHFALVFLLYPIGGLAGLVSIIILFAAWDALRRNNVAAAVVTAGVLSGIAAAGKLLIGIASMEVQHPDRGGIDWKSIAIFSLIFLPPIIVACRRLVLLWSNRPRGTNNVD